MVDTLEGECSVSQRQALTLFRCEVADHLVVVILLCEKRCALVTLVIERFGEYHVNLAENALRMVSLEELQNASLC
jgi:hypothetical protein